MKLRSCKQDKGRKKRKKDATKEKKKKGCHTCSASANFEVVGLDPLLKRSYPHDRERQVNPQMLLSKFDSLCLLVQV